MSRQAEEDLGFAVPGQEEEPECISRPVEEHENREGDISLLWLLQHYSKEHAAAYKEQRERKKSEQKKSEQTNKKHAGKKKRTKSAKQKVPVQPPSRGSQAEPAAKSSSGAGGNEEHFGETVIVDRKERPGLSKKPPLPEAALECVGFAETVPLFHLPFLIGRSSQGVDLCISDNKMVGRRHAVITCHKGQYYIRDLKALNHVYVDDVQIPPETEIQLHDQAKIALGNEVFIFHLAKQ